MVYMFKKWGERKEAEWEGREKRGQGERNRQGSNCEQEHMNVSTTAGGTNAEIQGGLNGCDDVVDVDIERGEKGVGKDIG